MIAEILFMSSSTLRNDARNLINSAGYLWKAGSVFMVGPLKEFFFYVYLF